MVDFNRNDLSKDLLTGLGNEKYLREQYKDYCASHDQAKMIMFDFTSFKKINDTFGHEEGDKCLITFARLLGDFFKNSLLIRLHGDEFIVVTSHSDERISKLLSTIDNSIGLDVERGLLKYKFSFNAGSVDCEEDIDTTMAKADCMMYYAKHNKDMYQPYNDFVFKEKIETDEMNNNFKNMLLTGDSFTYYGRKLFELNGKKTNFMQVYTKDKEGNSFLTSKLYSSIRNSTTIKLFDLHNLQRLVEKSSMSYTHSKYFINIDYKSLLSIKELIPFFETLKDSTYNGLNNVILSIDLTGIESTEYDMTLDIIDMLSSLGFKIKLDKVTNRIADYFVQSSNPNFIKLAVDEWKGIDDGKQFKILDSRISAYKLYGNKPKIIFDQVESESEANFIKNLCSDALASGNYYSKERRLRI